MEQNSGYMGVACPSHKYFTKSDEQIISMKDVKCILNSTNLINENHTWCNFACKREHRFDILFSLTKPLKVISQTMLEIE